MLIVIWKMYLRATPFGNYLDESKKYTNGMKILSGLTRTDWSLSFIIDPHSSSISPYFNVYIGRD